MIDFFRTNTKLINSLKNKYVIFSAGYKGGIGKTIISLGIAKELDIPYITNDEGSALSGGIQFYKNTYYTYDFKVDEKLEKSNIVMVDLAGCFVLDRTILRLIEKSNLIILPTGENPYLDHTGCLITANNLFDLNPNLLFITTGIENDKLKDTMFEFNKIKSKYPNFEKLKVMGLSKCNQIITESFAKKRTYLRTYLSLSDDLKIEYKRFAKDWTNIIKEINLRIGEN
ncbi:hypothetical protein Arnit_1764 [Arcobacter nitrofigilis DSM 7299]|uniref:CobQ/CobB/MinD/ParA nucleotide binding domain-containing protein n=1 Tax=Arcobacter nitrofigilis (strain ATCC 33309 / DSM 7299 / CCUG 15893 / LMG 7604 / NCTC 12251 / CI) TaxID=572480 RepID=D5V1I4_ARCNC|nr:hypothetical protein [Arcobacter nitrofigilis]ADG93418.1 hypothetical protein Arnit_1764 [Arcobacter nitrofigilis DSM 7299]